MVVAGKAAAVGGGGVHREALVSRVDAARGGDAPRAVVELEGDGVARNVERDARDVLFGRNLAVPLIVDDDAPDASAGAGAGGCVDVVDAPAPPPPPPLAF